MNFAKMAADLDCNPKIRKAGREAREIFLFLLRRNALLDAGGKLPASNVEPWYLADQLMMDEVTASHGVSRAVTAGLLRVTDAFVFISGWDDDWSKRAMTSAERQAKRRAKLQNKTESDVDVTKSHAPDVTSHASHTLEEKRLEESRGEEKKSDSPKAREPSGPHQQAVDEFTKYYGRTHGGAKPTWKGRNIKLMSELVKTHGAHEIVRRIVVLETHPPNFPPAPWDMPTFSQHFDKVAQPARAKHQNAPPGGLRAGDLLELQLERVREAEEAERAAR